jgi:hypothetical protein
MVGQHPFDCGHEDEGHRAEIHPPQFVATWRNAVLESIATRGPLAGIQARQGSYFPGPDTAATQVDTYASSFGGGAIGSEHLRDPVKWYQPVDDLDYQFIVRAPPKPTPKAQLFFASDLLLRRHDHGARPEVQELPGGEAYLVTLPLRGRGHYNEKVVSGWRMWAGWKGDDVPKAALRRYRVTFDTLKINDDLTGRWSAYEYVNERAGGSVLTGDGENANNERYKKVDADTYRLDDSYDVVLVPGQPLRVAMRASAWTKFGRTGGSEFAGTAEGFWPDPGSLKANLKSSDELLVGREENQCGDRRCFDVRVTISRR